MPKAGCNGYSLFAEQMRSSLEEKTGRQLLRITDLLREAAPYWLKLTETDKQGWKDRARDYKRSGDFALKKREARFAQWDKNNRPYSKHDQDQSSEYSEDVGDGQDPDVLDEFELPGPVSSAQAAKRKDFKFTVSEQGEILWNQELVPTEQGELRESLAPLSRDENVLKQQRSLWRERPAASINNSAPYNPNTIADWTAGSRPYTTSLKGDRDYGYGNGACQQGANGSVAMSAGRCAAGHNNKAPTAWSRAVLEHSQLDLSTDTEKEKERVFQHINRQTDGTGNTPNNAPSPLQTLRSRGRGQSISPRGKQQLGNNYSLVDRIKDPVVGYEVPPRLQRAFRNAACASSATASDNEAVLGQEHSQSTYESNTLYYPQDPYNSSIDVECEDSESGRGEASIDRDFEEFEAGAYDGYDGYEDEQQAYDGYDGYEDEQQDQYGFSTVVVFENKRYKQQQQKDTNDSVSAVHTPVFVHPYEGSAMSPPSGAEGQGQSRLGESMTGNHLLHSFNSAATASTSAVVRSDRNKHIPAPAPVRGVQERIWLSCAAPRLLVLPKVLNVLDMVGVNGHHLLSAHNSQSRPNIYNNNNRHNHSNGHSALPARNALFPFL